MKFYMSSPRLFIIFEKLLFIQKMHIEKFMIGKQQHMKWATGNQLLGVHESPK